MEFLHPYLLDDCAVVIPMPPCHCVNRPPPPVHVESRTHDATGPVSRLIGTSRTAGLLSDHGHASSTIAQGYTTAEGVAVIAPKRP
jgi:hypothetical protein